MEQSLTDRSDGEEQINPKVGGVHLMDNNLQSTQVCLKPDEYAGKF